MAKARSPNYPAITLPAAIDAARPIFAKDNRNKMSRLTVAKHLGYASLNGRALGQIGALRAYGLLEGGGDELRLTPDAITLAKAPEGSPDRKAALKRAFTSPSLYKEIWDHYEGRRPSEENLRFWLVQQGFTDRGADKCAASYLESYDLVSPEIGGYIGEEPAETRKMEPRKHDPMLEVFAAHMNPKSRAAPAQATAQPDMRKEVFTLDEGDVVLTFPDNLSYESYEDLEDHLQLFLRKAKRRAEAEKGENKK